MTNSGYIVHCRCLVCGRIYLAWLEFPLPGGPTEPCTLSEHYPDGDLPPRIIGSSTSSLLWCDQAGEDFAPYGRPLPVRESGQVCPGRQTP